MQQFFGVILDLVGQGLFFRVLSANKWPRQIEQKLARMVVHAVGGLFVDPLYGVADLQIWRQCAGELKFRTFLRDLGEAAVHFIS